MIASTPTELLQLNFRFRLTVEYRDKINRKISQLSNLVCRVAPPPEVLVTMDHFGSNRQVGKLLTDPIKFRRNPMILMNPMFHVPPYGPLGHPIYYIHLRLQTFRHPSCPQLTMRSSHRPSMRSSHRPSLNLGDIASRRL